MAPDRPEFVTVSSDGTARLWDLATGARLLRGPYDGNVVPGDEPPAEAMGVTFDAGRRLTIGGRDGRLTTWSFAEGRFVQRAGEPSDAVIDAARSADGTTLVTLSAHQAIRVWSAALRPGPTTALTLAGEAFSVAVAGDLVAVGTAGGEVLVFDAASGRDVAHLTGHRGRVFALAFAGDDRLVTGDEEGTLRLWNWAAGRVEVTRPGAHRGPLTAVAVAEEQGVVASAGDDRVLRLWDLDGLVARGDALGPLAAPLTDVAFGPDGRTVVASAANGEVGRWSIAGGRALGAPFRAEDNTVWAVAVSPDGRTLAAATDDEVVSLWSLDGDRPPVRLREVGGHAGGALDVAFVDQWTMAATSRTGQVRLWDVASGQALGSPLQGDDSPAWHLAVTPDGTVWTVSQEGWVLRVDALVVRVACELARGSFDARQRDRLLGGDDPVAC